MYDLHFTAVVSSRNDYLLNGGFTINLFPQKMEVKGAVLEFSGSETYQERINSTGMLGENIHLQVSVRVLFWRHKILIYYGIDFIFEIKA